MSLSDSEPTKNADPSPASSAEGLATASYLAIRGKEECYRAHRYGRPLALVVVELDQPDLSTDGRLQNWLRLQTRASDLVAMLGTSAYALLLPESDERAAAGIIARMRTAFSRLSVSSGSYPADGATWEDFLDNVLRKTHGPPGKQRDQSQAN